MDTLAAFLKTAKWTQLGDQEGYFCDDPGLEPKLKQATSQFPDLRGFGFQAYMILVNAGMKEKNGIGNHGYIIPVEIIAGEPRLVSEPGEPALLPGCPIEFKQEPRITPALYFIAAFPPRPQ
jgi:hypothetical protein